MTDLLKQMADALRRVLPHVDRGWDDCRADAEFADAALALFDAQAAEQAAGGGEAAPYCHVYEYDSPLGFHRALYPKQWNGKLPDRTVPVYTHPSPAAPVQQVGEREAFEEWRELQPYRGATYKQERAFLDGYRAALAARGEKR